MAEQTSVPVRVLASLTPILLAVALVALVNLPISVTGGLMPAPILALAPVYYWTLVRPDLMPPIAALGLGLLEDMLSGGPPGLWASGFLAAYVLANRQRDAFAGLSGIGAVVGFGTAVFLAGGVAYALAALVYWQASPLAPLLLECAITTLFYVLLMPVIAPLHHHFIGPMRGDD